MPEPTPSNPGEAIQAELARRGWIHDDLARVLGRHRPDVTNLISGKRAISPEIAVELSAALGQSPDYWLGLESVRQLSLVNGDAATVVRRKRLYEMAPVREMERRGWIAPAQDVDALDGELCRFFGVSSLDEEPRISVAPRGIKSSAKLTVEQRAWVFRARQIASAMPTVPFEQSRMPALKKRLREIAAYPEEARHVSRAFSEHGIRFVVVETLPGGSIDGAAFWLREDAPVIALSMRYDRVDWFWFTLCHELSHVVHADAWSVDDRLVGPDEFPVQPGIEQRANAEAATTLIPKETLDSFIQRVGPLYSKTRVIQFAHTIKIHPGIIVGQLHHRQEIKPNAHRDVLVKIRERVLSTAVTDGWSRSIGTL